MILRTAPGIDNGVHLVHRHRTDTSAVEVLSTSTARAVFYASVTTILSFGSLGLASHRAIAAIGRLLTLGVLLTLVCYVIVLPAVLEWDDRHMVIRVDGQQIETREIPQGQPEGAGSFFTESVEEPAIRLRHDGQRCEPSMRWIREQTGGGLVIRKGGGC